MKKHGLPIFAALILPAAPAGAFLLDNCTDQPQTVIVQYFAEKQEVRLEPGKSRMFYGFPAELHYGEQKVRVSQRDDHYCVWPDGISIQRRNTLDRGR